MNRISVIIPVFRESNRLENLLTQLLQDSYRKKEILIAIDEPSKNSISLIKKYRKEVTFIVNKKRVGKVKAMNEAVKKSHGELLFFLDSDDKIENRLKDLLQKIVNGMEGHDYATLKVSVDKKSFLGKMGYFDCINVSLIHLLFEKFLKKTPVFGGQAIVVKRDVFNKIGGFQPEISEDLDIATRLYLNGKKFVYLKNIEVVTAYPNDSKHWLTQRTRWGMGTGIWLKKNYKTLLKNSAYYPHLFLGSLIIAFPTLLLFAINILLSKSFLEKAVYFILLLIPIKVIESLPFIFFIFSSIVIIKSVILYFMSFLISLSITFATAKFMKFEFSFKEYLFFYFIFAPLSLSFYLITVVKGMMVKPELKDWKV